MRKGSACYWESQLSSLRKEDMALSEFMIYWAHIKVSQGGNSCNFFLNYCENRQTFPNYCKFTQLNCCELQNIGFSFLFLLPSPFSFLPLSLFPPPLSSPWGGGREGGVLRTIMSPFPSSIFYTSNPDPTVLDSPDWMWLGLPLSFTYRLYIWPYCPDILTPTI